MILLINPKKIKLKIKHCYLGLFEDVKSLVMMKLFLLLTNLVSQKLCLEKRRSNFQFETWEHLHRYLWATWNLNWLFNVYVQDDNQNLLRSSNRQYVWKGCKWKHHIWDCNCKKIESRPNWILMSLADLGETSNPTF